MDYEHLSIPSDPTHPWRCRWDIDNNISINLQVAEPGRYPVGPGDVDPRLAHDGVIQFDTVDIFDLDDSTVDLHADAGPEFDPRFTATLVVSGQPDMLIGTESITPRPGDVVETLAGCLPRFALVAGALCYGTRVAVFRVAAMEALEA